MRTYIDMEYLTPVVLEAHDWDDKHLLTCRYAFHNVKFNVGLTEKDFLPEANGMTEPH
jgi:outer membrane lipoprotein-sorting protein